MMHNILVTGSSGFLGQEIVKKLLELKYKVTALDKKKKLLKNKNLINYRGDIKPFLMNNDISKYYGIIHLAAESRETLSYSNPSEFIQNNVLNVIYFLESLKKTKKKPFFIFAGTLDARKNDKKTVSPYLISKNTCEKIIRFYNTYFNIKSCILVLSDLYSINQVKSERFLYKAIKLLKNNKQINIFDKNHEFYYFNIEGLIKSLNKIISNFRKNSFFEVNCYSNTSINIVDLVTKLKKLTKSKSKIKFYKAKKNTKLIKSKMLKIKKYKNLDQNLKLIINYPN